MHAFKKLCSRDYTVSGARNTENTAPAPKELKVKGRSKQTGAGWYKKLR